MQRKTLPLDDTPSRRPTIRALPSSTQDPLYQEILDDYEEAILSGCSKDDAAAFALISDADHSRLLANQIESNPEWLNDLALVGKSNLRATARVNAARHVRAGNPNFILPIAQATSPDLNPKTISISLVPQLPPITEDEQKVLDTMFNRIIDVTPITRADDGAVPPLPAGAEGGV